MTRNCYAAEWGYPEKRLELLVEELPVSLRPDWWAVALPTSWEHWEPIPSLVEQGIFKGVEATYILDRRLIVDLMNNHSWDFEIPALLLIPIGHYVVPGENYGEWKDADDEGTNDILTEIEGTPNSSDAWITLPVKEFGKLDQNKKKRVCHWRDYPNCFDESVAYSFDKALDFESGNPSFC